MGEYQKRYETFCGFVNNNYIWIKGALRDILQLVGGAFLMPFLLECQFELNKGGKRKFTNCSIKFFQKLSFFFEYVESKIVRANEESSQEIS